MAKRLFFIAGEISGDIHAASVISRLKDKHQDYQIIGVGGERMANAGMSLLYPLAQHGVTGFVEVLKQCHHIFRAYRAVVEYIETHPVDVAILVDYPGFNLRIAKQFKKRGIRVLYYICPQVWAWKANRIKTLKRYVDELAVILPFEQTYFSIRGLRTTYVGHPLAFLSQKHFDKPKLMEKYALDKSHIIIGLMPGSRQNEISALLPIINTAAHIILDNHPVSHKVTFIIPIAPGISDDIVTATIDSSLPIQLYSNQDSHELMACCDTIIAASGTASFEAMLLRVPTIILYKVSWLTYLIATQVIKVRYIGLGNLISNKMVSPELLQSDLTAKSLAAEMLYMISSKDFKRRYACEVNKMISMVRETSDNGSIVNLIENNLGMDNYDPCNTSSPKPTHVTS